MKKLLQSTGRWVVVLMALAVATNAHAKREQNPALKGRTTHQQRATAAATMKATGFLAPTLDAATLSAATMATPGSTPHYFSVGNYANSPLRLPDVQVTIAGDGTGAAATATVDLATGTITGLTLDAPGAGYTTATVSFSSPITAGLPPELGFTGGTGALATATVDLATGTISGLTLDAGGSGYVTAGIKKFVDTLPGVPGVTTLGAVDAARTSEVNNLGQYIPVAVADTTSYPGSDYYEVAVVQYRERMHSQLPRTLLRGYVQLETTVNAATSKHVPLVNVNKDGSTTPVLLNGQQVYAYDDPHYLGPVIAATKDRPTRILFRNLLPTGIAGDLFIPADTTVMGAGPGPVLANTVEPNPRDPMCASKVDVAKLAGCFTENRATLHLHGGISPWISDGTPHQWVTPPTENAVAYPTKGVSVQNVPDMPDPGPGAITFFYTNQQSARLLFYHDHAWGITRLNVYAGEAAGYLITDDAEKKLITDSVIPADTLPLVIQDKTFVPSTPQLSVQDPLWDLLKWGNYGQLWLPHVYVPAQTGDANGVNAYGRWAYGPWFWPPTNNILYPPMDNPYFVPGCVPGPDNGGFCEPALIPGTPFNSMGMEAFHDTPVVNGTVYPTVTLAPKAYRFRVLNAANDRFFNLQLYVADASGTEVALDPALVEAALTDPAGNFPTPVAPVGPSWIQIGTEGGFLPTPVVIPPQPITWVTDPTVFNAGNVDKHSLLLGPAERADVIVDFSAFAGQTLILYNDAPAAFPARDPRYDYYTGNPDLQSTGGAPPTIPGYGPNTRTIMQIKIAATTPAQAFDLAALNTAFAHKADNSGVFESSQNPIVVGQSEYNAAYGTSFPPSAGIVQIFDDQLQIQTLAGARTADPADDLLSPMALENKAIQDEMGEAFEPDYGRMSGNLGLEAPNKQAGQAQILILYPFVNPPSEVLKAVEFPMGVNVQPITTTTDGTQIWKITHNGVDTHPIHFHLFDVQVLNRVGWDGIVRRTEPNELGWKDTLRISPLEDTIVAVRPIVPKLPFGLPDSMRLLNPAMPAGSPDGFNNTDKFGNPLATPITNQIYNFGWEYVWHCHILSHEEMDMMRPISVNASRVAPNPPLLQPVQRNLTTGAATLTWADGTPVDYANLATWGDPANEIGFRVERANVNKNGSVGTYTSIATLFPNVTTYVDGTAVLGTNYSYRIAAYNASGTTYSLAVGGTIVAPAAPTNAVATLQAGPQVTLTFKDNATNESYFVIERAVDGGAFAFLVRPAAFPKTGTVTYVDTTITAGHTYQYRVAALNGGGQSAWATSGTVTTPATPTAPTLLSATAVISGKKANVTVRWTDTASNESSFVLDRATNASFTVGLVSTTYPASTVAAPATVTVTQTGLYRGVTYYYRVRATNLGGNSAWTPTVSVVTP